MIYVNIGTDSEPDFKKGKIINYNNISKCYDVELMLDNKSYAKDENGIILFTFPADKIKEDKPKILKKSLFKEPTPIENRIKIDEILLNYL
jgi:hypothetical protein